MTHDFDLTADPLTDVRVTAATPRALEFLDAFGIVDDATASTFIHAAQRAGFSVRHFQGDIPEGMGLIAWHDQWDYGRGR